MPQCLGRCPLEITLAVSSQAWAWDREPMTQSAFLILPWGKSNAGASDSLLSTEAAYFADFQDFRQKKKSR